MENQNHERQVRNVNQTEGSKGQLSSNEENQERSVRKKNQRGSWTTEQKKILLKYFKNNIEQKITPKKQECLNCQEKYKNLLNQKTWVQIKVFVYNTFKKT